MQLRATINTLEDAIITLSGPALAISGIIAGVDLLTGGSMLKQIWWLALAWAICLLLTLDFQVLALGARSHKIYLSDKSGWQKFAEIAIAFVIAASISYVSIQMQSIIARSNSAGLDITTATMQLGINPIWLIWERSALVLFLIFMSGWFREERTEQNPTEQNRTHEDAIKQLAEQVSILAANMGQITATVTEVKTTVTEITAASLPALPMPTEPHENVIESDPLANRTPIHRTEQNPQETNPGNKKEQVRTYLRANPGASISEIMIHTGVTKSYASSTRSRILNERKGEEHP